MVTATLAVVNERSLALHQEVARRLLARPELLERAKRRVDGWATDGSVHPHWVAVWQELLARPVTEVAAAIVEESERGVDLRQTSPFAGVLDPATRWRILRALGS